MPDSVAAVAGSTVSPTVQFDPLAQYGVPVAGPTDNSTIDKDAFLRLLVAQLKYQDPLEPTSNEQFIATTAQFTTVERLNELTAQGKAQAATAALTTASALVGREVSVVNGLGQAVPVHVQQARLISGEVVLMTDGGAIGLNDIIGIGPMTDTSSPTTGTGTTGTGTGATDSSSTTATGSTGTTDSSTTTTTDPGSTTDTTNQETTVQ